MEYCDLQARIDALANYAGVPGLAVFTVYLRGGLADGQRQYMVLRPDQARVGEHVSLSMTVEHAKREPNWPWTKNIARQAEYELISVEAGLAVAQFVGEQEVRW